MLEMTTVNIWMWSVLALAGAFLLGLVVHFVVYSAARRLARRTASTLDESLVEHTQRPVQYILPLLFAQATLRIAPLPEAVAGPLTHGLGLAMIGLIAWLIMTLLDVAQDLVQAKYAIDVADNLEARRVQTQIRVLRRIGVVVLSILALAAMLMTFPNLRNVGQTLFASAGLAGLVVGFAARPTFGSLVAGIQIALTQPIRIDDVVIVEGEWGRVEEITTTYVVVRIWDLRRLVVPLTYFIEHPFQNWTRQTADILGTVFLYVDYTVPVEEVRQELHRVLKEAPGWDGKVWNLQVTDATDRSLELRALMSAADAGLAWDLRCYVRERLLDFLQRSYPESLPRSRAELKRVAASAGTA